MVGHRSRDLQAKCTVHILTEIQAYLFVVRGRSERRSQGQQVLAHVSVACDDVYIPQVLGREGTGVGRSGVFGGCGRGTAVAVGNVGGAERRQIEVESTLAIPAENEENTNSKDPLLYNLQTLSI